MEMRERRLERAAEIYGFLRVSINIPDSRLFMGVLVKEELIGQSLAPLSFHGR